MKKLFFLPLAALALAACSESTEPNVADVTPVFGKPGTPPPSGTCSGCNQIASYDFESGVVTANGGTTVGTELEEGAAGDASAATVVTSPGPSFEKFLGRFENVDTRVVINIPAGYNRYGLTFDFYTIGSWDGRGKQAQQGTFLANLFQFSYRCAAGAAITTFQTTFSNQLTVQQDFPNTYLTGGYKAATGSFEQDRLNYRSVPAISNTPLFRSFGDVSYHMAFAGANPCGSNALQLIIGTSNPSQQSVRDESWGVDNIVIEAGS